MVKGGVKPEACISGIIQGLLAVLVLDRLMPVLAKGVNDSLGIFRQHLENAKREKKGSLRGAVIDLPDVEQKPDEFLCLGVGSRQYSGKHVLFLDLDKTTVPECEKIARKLIRKYGLSTCYVVQSSVGNHHLVCLDALPFEQILGIAKQYAHKQWTKYRGKEKDFVIRISPKLKLEKIAETSVLMPVKDTQPMLISKVESPFNNYTKSNSLRQVFQNLWATKIKKDKYFGKSQRFRSHFYRVRLKPNKGVA